MNNNLVSLTSAIDEIALKMQPIKKLEDSIRQESARKLVSIENESKKEKRRAYIRAIKVILWLSAAAFMASLFTKHTIEFIPAILAINIFVFPFAFRRYISSFLRQSWCNQESKQTTYGGRNQNRARPVR